MDKRIWLIRFVILTFLLIFFKYTYQIPINEINIHINVLADSIRDKEKIELTVKDKLGIYGLNLSMGICAYPLYPEIAKETIMMVIPPPENNIRIYYSNNLLMSRKIESILKEFNDKLLNYNGNKKQVVIRKRLSWDISEYKWGESEARYALAINPSIMTLKAEKENSVWKVTVCIKVKCKYPRNSKVTLIGEPELNVEEGLFWILQKDGWLHPYTAEWRYEYQIPIAF